MSTVSLDGCTTQDPVPGRSENPHPSNGHPHGEAEKRYLPDRSYLSLADMPIETGGKNPSWKSCQHNSRIWLQEERISIRYNAFSGEITIDGIPLRDEHAIIDQG